MKRFHVHVSVRDLQESVRFYSGLFGAPPSVEKPDYAKWMLDDPRINFAISRRGHAAGVNHLGFQVESDEDLKELHEQVVKAGLAALDQTGDVVLLRQVGQVLDRGSPRRRLGNVSHARQRSHLRRRSKTQRGKERVLHSAGEASRRRRAERLLCSNEEDGIRRGLLQLKPV